MPNIELIPQVLHEAMQPYHYHYDNLPLQAILDRLDVVNSAVDNNSQQIRESVGTQGTLANRLAQSLNEDGTLITSAVDTALHAIGSHTDGDGYVRMTEDEQEKLALISDNATALSMQFDSGSTIVLFEDDLVEFTDSDTITWEVVPPNQIQANVILPASYYGLVPTTVDYTTYTLVPFTEDTLRVYINGVRIFSDVQVYVPDSTVTNWTLTSFTPSYLLGTFVVDRTLDASDIVRIDFETA